jgi:membrane-associated protease RseP (regulator of RpoE activity)
MDGTGAAAVGLQKDDVLVKMGEHELTDFPSLTDAIRSFKAEQVVKTEFYRGAEMHSVEMTLSRRPFPEFPNTAKEFAAEMRKLYKELDAELEAAFEGVSEEEATARPGEEEWCAKEVIAHLIYTERWFQLWLSTTVAGLRAPGFNNDHGLIEALSKSYPTAADALIDLKVCEQTSAAAVENLKDDFVSQKLNYYGLAAWPLQGVAPHTRGHITQIQEAIQAARAN